MPTPNEEKGSQSEQSGSGGANDTKVILPQDDSTKSVHAFWASHGGSERATRLLIKQTFKLREKIRNIKEAPDGAVVLTGDEVKTWEAFQKLGVKVEELEKTLGEVADLRTKVQTAEVAELAKEAGYKAGLLRPLVKDVGGTLEKRSVTETVDGKKVTKTVVFITVGDKSEPLDDFAARTWKEELPSLREKADSTETAKGRRASAGNGTTPPDPQSGNTKPYIPQRSSGDSADEKTAADVYSQRNRIRPSKLREQASGAGRAGSGSSR